MPENKKLETYDVEVFAEERGEIESLSGADLIFFDIVLLPSDR